MATVASAPVVGTDGPADVCRRYPAAQTSLALIPEAKTVPKFLTALLGSGQGAESARVVAHWLPKPHVIWWGCLCAWHLYRPQPSPSNKEVLEAVLRWLVEPTDARREGLQHIAEDFGMSSLVGCLAQACAWSEGSMTPRGTPPVEPPPYLPGRVVAAGLVVETDQRPGPTAAADYHQYVQIGLEVAAGRHLWY